MAWGVAIALQAAVLPVLFSARFGMRCGPERWASRALGVIGLIAVIWTLLPVAILTACI